MSRIFEPNHVMQGEVVKVCEKDSEFHWILGHFSSRRDPVRSLPFRSCGRSWQLDIVPNSLPWRESEYIWLYLRAHDFRTPIVVQYSAGIRTAGGETEACATGTKTFTFSASQGVSHGFWYRLIKRSELLRRGQELLPLRVLTIVFTLTLEDRSSETVIEKSSVHAILQEIAAYRRNFEPLGNTGVDKIVEDVGKLWPNGDHTDVVLKVKGVEFKAHRAILAARTPVLGAMFQHDTIEKASGEVCIDDCEPEVFEQLLHYIYKGAPRELTAENAGALYLVADKYLVSEVKSLCVRCMRDTLRLDTFCDTLALSLLHKDDELLKAATEFFSRNMVDVLTTVEWQRFLREHPTWANDTVIRATKLIAPVFKRKSDFL